VAGFHYRQARVGAGFGLDRTVQISKSLLSQIERICSGPPSRSLFTVVTELHWPVF